jgi:hypothetical protein
VVPKDEEGSVKKEEQEVKEEETIPKGEEEAPPPKTISVCRGSPNRFKLSFSVSTIHQEAHDLQECRSVILHRTYRNQEIPRRSTRFGAIVSRVISENEHDNDSGELNGISLSNTHARG